MNKRAPLFVWLQLKIYWSHFFCMAFSSIMMQIRECWTMSVPDSRAKPLKETCRRCKCLCSSLFTFSYNRSVSTTFYHFASGFLYSFFRIWRRFFDSNYDKRTKSRGLVSFFASEEEQREFGSIIASERKMRVKFRHFLSDERGGRKSTARDKCFSLLGIIVFRLDI